MTFSTHHQSLPIAPNVQLQQAILEKIAKNHPLPDILSALCVYVEQILPSSVCSVMLVNEQNGTLTVGAVPTGGETACTILDGLVPGEFAGACGTAVHTGTTVIIEDSETDPRWEPIREAARPLGIKSCWSIPIFGTNQQILGTFAISHLQIRRPTTNDFQLLETASSLAGIALQRTRDMESIVESGRRYRDLYESAPLAYVTSYMDGRIKSVNIRAAELLGSSPEKLEGRFVVDLYAPGKNGREKAQMLNMQTQEGCEIEAEELEMQRADGSHVWVSLTVRIIRDQTGKPIERRGIVEDITPRKRNEHIQNLQQTALELTLTKAPLQEILNTLCNEVEVMVPSAICSILTFDQKLQTLTFQAGPSVPDSLAQALDGMLPGACAGSCGTATYRGEPVYVSNTATDPLWADLQEVAKQFNIRACWSFPILAEGKHVLGSFAISSPHPHSPVPSDIRLLETVSYLAGIALCHRETEQALLESEQRHRTLYEDNPTMYFTISADGNILSVNEFGAQQLGYSVQEIVGQPVSILCYEKDMEDIARQFAECLEGPQQLSHWEFRKVRKDGSLLWVKETARMIHDPQGHPIILVVCEDVTDTKITQQALRDSEQRFRSVVQSATEAIIFADEHGNITSWNAAAEKMFGYNPNEVQGKPLSLIVPERYWEAHQQGLERIRTTSRARSIGKVLEAEGLRKNGEEFPVELSLGTWTIGSERHFCGIIRDVTERKQAEEQRRAIEQRFESVVQSATEAIILADETGHITSWNTAAELMFGWTEKEARGKPLQVIIPQRFIEDHKQGLARIRTAGKTKTSGQLLEATGLKKNGKEFPVEVSNATWTVGSERHFCGIIRDVTERKRAEDQRQASEQAIRALYDITSSNGMTFEQRVEALLELGRQRFHLPSGLLTRRREKDLEVQYINQPHPSLPIGRCIPLYDTFCSSVLVSEKPISFEHAAQTEWRDHPGYSTLHIEAYLGTKVIVGTETYGTLCFTSLEPHIEKFTDADKDFLMLMARWIGGELERITAEEALRTNEKAIRALYDITSTHGMTFDKQARALLEIGCNRFQLATGIIHQLDGDRLILTTVHGKGAEDLEGVSVPLDQTYCLPTVETNQPVAFEHADETVWERFPLAGKSQTRAYLGAPIQVGDRLFGTLCFNDKKPHLGAFTEADKDFLQLMAQWIGTELERQKDEEILKETNVALTNAMPGISQVTPEGHYSHVNALYAQMVGYASEELIGQSWEPLLHPDDLPIAQKAYQEMLAVGKSEFEARGIRKNGEEFFKQVLMVKRTNLSGDLTGHHCFMRDITDRKHADEALRVSEERLQSILDHSPAVIYLKDLEGKYLLINKQFANLFDLDQVYVKGKTDFDIFPKEIASAFQDTDQTALKKNRAVEREEVAPQRDGLHTYISNKFPLRDIHGLPYAVCGISTDITKRKRAEEALYGIVEGTGSITNENIFHSLAKNLAQCLRVKYAFITECCSPGKSRVKTLAFWTGDSFGENFEYEIAGTPCEEAIKGAACHYPHNVQDSFPNDFDLKTLQIQGYVGIPLFSQTNEVLGHIVTMDEKPLEDDFSSAPIVKIFSSRAGVEIERKQVEEALRGSQDRLRQVIDLVPHFIFAKDQEGRFILSNQAVADVYGTTVESLIGKTDGDFHATHLEVDQFRQDDLEVIACGETKIIKEDQFTDSSGNIRFLQTTKIPFVFSDSTSSSVLGVSIDITEQKRAEEQLREAYNQTRELSTRLEAAEESERKRIARELHDEFGQMLTGLKFDMAWIQRRLAEISDQTHRGPLVTKLESMTHMTDDLIHTVRRIATSLRPSILDDLGLLPALEWQVQDFQQRTGILCTFKNRLGQPLQLHNDRETALFRIAQELFTNIIRHAEATEVNLSLSRDGDTLTLLVMDNGKGIQDHHTATQTLGLLGIKERVSSFGGEFVIIGSKAGTHATVSIPLT